MRVANVLTRQKMQDVLVRCLRLDDTAVNAPSLDDFRALACLWMQKYLLVSLLHTRRRTHLLVYDKYAYVQAHTAHTRTCVRVQALGQDQQLKDTHTHTHTHTNAHRRLARTRSSRTKRNGCRITRCIWRRLRPSATVLWKRCLSVCLCVHVSLLSPGPWPLSPLPDLPPSGTSIVFQAGLGLSQVLCQVLSQVAR